MPEMSGPELQRELKRRGCGVPIVFITAQVDETVRTRALEAGAASVCSSLFSPTALLEALDAALPGR